MSRSDVREPVFGTVAVACDHGGLSLKETVLGELSELGIDARDMGTHSQESVDYPEYAAAAALEVARGSADAAILICGTGLGMAISANKIDGVRAVTCGDEYSARMSRAHNDANVLTMGARVLGGGLAGELVRVFCTTSFDGGRHARRVEAMSALERDGEST